MTGEVGYKKVLKTFVSSKEKLIHIKVGETFIETTEEHPFWVVGYGFKNAGDIEAGDYVETAEGIEAEITFVETVEVKPTTTYNFEVEDWHTYFVSDVEVWVHNKCPKKIKEYDVLPYSKFNTKNTVGDGISGHELLQNAWLEANGKIEKRGVGLSRSNPAIGLKEDPTHSFVTALQKSKGYNKEYLETISWRRNVLDNIEIIKKTDAPREKILELVKQTRDFAIKNKF
ncbi:MAG: HINT domain-containing protein [Lachnospiraceae bacterium]|nr:HINT domain-containing protein [Lachnospiraceae bacterium]